VPVSHISLKCNSSAAVWSSPWRVVSKFCSMTFLILGVVIPTIFESKHKHRCLILESKSIPDEFL